MSRIPSPPLLALSLALYLLASLLPSAPFERFNRYGPGNVDLISFWSAHQLLYSQQNPYHEESLRTLQSTAGQSGIGKEPTKVTWNPPWFLVLLTPILKGSLGRATVLMFALNIGCFVGTVALLNRRWWKFSVVAVAILFYPFLQTLLYGQSSALLTLIVALSFVSFLEKRESLCGVSLALLSIKPHLIIGYVAGVLALTLIQKRWRLIGSAALALGVLLVLPSLISPRSVPEWIQKVFIQGESQSVLDWRTATLASFLREILATDGRYATWVVPIMFGLSLASSIYLATKVRGEKGLLLALCASVGLSPYGWVFDSTLFLVPMLYLLQPGPRYRATISVLFALDIFLLSAAAFIESQHEFFFLPLLVAAVIGGILALRFADNAHTPSGGAN